MKGLSSSIGFLIFLLIIMTTLIPLAIFILSQNANQQSQTNQNINFYGKQLLDEYSEFSQYSYGNVFSNVIFVYNIYQNSVCFIMSSHTTSTSSSPPIYIKYLLIFNGTRWVYLNIIKNAGILYAEPSNNDANILISFTNKDSLNISNNSIIKIHLPNNIRPYENQSAYIVAVTQYGDIIYAVPYAMPTNYYIFEGGILPSFDLPFNYLTDESVSFTYPDIIRYYNIANSCIYWNGLNSFRPYEYYFEKNDTLDVHLNGIWFNTKNIYIPQVIGPLSFENLSSNYVDINLSIPVLQLSSSNVQYGGGEVLWNETYMANQNISMEYIATYTAQDLGEGGGLDFYLFINPDQWNVSSSWNSSALFPQQYIVSCNIWQPLLFLPKSTSPYLILSWSSNGWNLFYNYNNNTKIIDAISSSQSFSAQPGDFILFNIKYVPYIDTLYVIAYNYNTSQEETSVFDLNNIFSPPDSGNYVFGIASFNHGVASNWGIIYTDVPALEALFDPSLQDLFTEIPSNITLT